MGVTESFIFRVVGGFAFSVLGRLNAERFIRALLLALLVSHFHCNPSSVLAAEWYVDAGVATSGDGKTWETAFQTIQEGIDAAWDGDTVIVGEGVYYENIRFHDRNIVLRSRNPLDSDVIRNTIIDGNQAGSVVTFSGREDASCAIGGFTIRNGAASYGGGIRSEYRWRRSQARIEKNVIYGNSTTGVYNHGGGVGYCDGRIEGNTIWGNSADCGGGLACCNGEIRNNVILRNAALEQGGGLYCCDGVIENNVVTENKAVGDSEGKGGGLYECNGTIQNDTIVGNSAPEGGGLYGCEGAIGNCIIWANSPRTGDQLIESREPTYSCIEGWMHAGEGNIFVAPHFVDADRGDYHLTSWSPCIDAGDPASPFSMEPEPNGERVNMGAYGNTREAASKSPDTDADALPDGWELRWFKNLQEHGASDPEGDGIPNITEYRYGWDPSTPSETLVENLAKGMGYETIQAALLESSDAEEIVAHPGIYQENISFAGRNVVLRSREPSDAAVVAATMIEGNRIRSVVTFSGREDETCVLAGFTIQNGEAEAGGGICGGAPNEHTLARILNNVVTRNSAVGESPGGGGGVAYCDGTIQNNIVSGNSATGNGGGLAYCHGTVQNNLIAGNVAVSRFAAGGGLYQCHGTLQNNTIAGNSAIGEHGRGGGVAHCRGMIRNCIIWGNAAQSGEGEEVYKSHTPSFSCVENWTGGGTGNTSGYPRFVSAPGGDYRLRAKSPCIDTGANFYWFAWPQRELDGKCRLIGDRVDMGCYEYGSSPDADGDLLADAEEPASGTDPVNDDTDGDGLRDGLELLRGSDPLAATPPGIVDVPSGVGTIQEALCLAVSGDEIVVSPGIYPVNLQFCGTDVILRGSGNQNSAGIGPTILDGGSNGPVVSFVGYESEACVLAGFTIQNGRAEHGGGIHGAMAGCHTGATIQNNEIIKNAAYLAGGGLYGCDGLVRNNTITRNSATEQEACGGGLAYCNGKIENNTITGNVADMGDGGGMAYCDGTIRSNTITGNSASRGGGLYACGGTVEDNLIGANSAYRGGGLFACHAAIRRNTIVANTARADGGGLNDSDGTIQNNTITGNSAGAEGGGLVYCGGAIEDNTISGNSATDHGGGLAECDCVIRRNTIMGNSSERNGGGLAYCGGTIRNNIIVGNSSTDGGGLAECRATIQNNTICGNFASYNSGGLYRCGRTIINCIIWGNVSSRGGELYKSGPVRYCCVQGLTYGGEGNIAENPGFADSQYHLSVDSPCIDAGRNEEWMWEAIDADGNPRIYPGAGSWRVDIGACEFVPVTYQPLGFVRAADRGVQIMWTSQFGQYYTVWSCLDLVTGEWREEVRVLAPGLSSSWTDWDTTSTLKFYRIQIE